MLEDIISDMRRKFTDQEILEELSEEYEEADIKAALARVPRQGAPTAAPGAPAAPRGKPAPRPDCEEIRRKSKAPYRFAALNRKVVAGTIVDHDAPLPDGFCVRLKVGWTAETPLLIGAENGDAVGPQKLWDAPDAAYAVPGASLRGMLRSALEIVAHGRLHRINGHHRYGLRDFEHPNYKTGGHYPLSDVNSVHAGWLRKNGAEYVISPCEWSQVEVTALPGVRDGFDWTNQSLRDKYRAFRMEQLDFQRRDRFRSDDDLNNKSLLVPDAKGSIEGVYVFSDKVPNANRDAWEQRGKKVEYVFHGRNGAEIALTDQSMAQFLRLNTKPSKNRQEPDGTWKLLSPKVEKGGSVPVFYVGDLAEQGAGFAFGLTRLFKVPHQYSVADIAKRSQGDVRPCLEQGEKTTIAGIDFVENLFGFVLEDDAFTYKGSKEKPKALARKGRISFGFAEIPPDRVQETEAVPTVMMGARASFAPFYLAGKFKDYSDPNARLAGRKRYLPRYPGGEKFAPLKEMLSKNKDSDDKQKIISKLKFLVGKDGGAFAFDSEIRLHNVTAAEVGAVLWVLTHGGAGQCRHMLGRAKPFGAGQLRAEIVECDLVSNRPHGHVPTPEECRAAFETAMDSGLGKPGTWAQSAPVREFLALSDPRQGQALAQAGLLQHLPLGDFNTVRKAAKLHHNAVPPCPPEDRYLTLIDLPAVDGPRGK